ncbi:MAG: hypothetical protein V2A79_18525 [Planctomycetota bacterium]
MFVALYYGWASAGLGRRRQSLERCHKRTLAAAPKTAGDLERARAFVNRAVERGNITPNIFPLSKTGLAPSLAVTPLPSGEG